MQKDASNEGFFLLTQEEESFFQKLLENEKELNEVAEKAFLTGAQINNHRVLDLSAEVSSAASSKLFHQQKYQYFKTKHANQEWESIGFITPEEESIFENLYQIRDELNKAAEEAYLKKIPLNTERITCLNHKLSEISMHHLFDSMKYHFYVNYVRFSKKIKSNIKNGHISLTREEEELYQKLYSNIKELEQIAEEAFVKGASINTDRAMALSASISSVGSNRTFDSTKFNDFVAQIKNTQH